ncbi:hypothetical protein BGZ60DRAFT_433708 [Tricladium varicosporioides]|nr:hypothetical protein BGZ60DRAFT_433708 [Hymenoscyphus varicosporioides]
MADRTENQPFLGRSYHDDPQDNSHDNVEGHFIRVLPASAHFKRAVKILAVFTAALSLSVFGLLVADYVLIASGSFNSTWSARDTTRDLFIVLFTTFLVTSPTIFLSIPVLLNFLIHLTMSITVFIFAGQLFANGWPDKWFCGRWVYENIPGSPYDSSSKWVDGSPACYQRMTVVRIVMGVAGGLSIVIGVLLLTTTLLQAVALARTRFWKGANFKRYVSLKGLRNWKPAGFTIQFTLTIMPPMKRGGSGALVGAEGAEGPKPVAGSSTDGGRLIET